MKLRERAEILERLYHDLNRREYVHPDPLEFLYHYEDPADREVVALIASSLAYGRVAQILASVSVVLEKLGPRPARCLMKIAPTQLRRKIKGFRHRFNTGEEVAAMLLGAKDAIEQYGSLGACFSEGLCPGDKTILPALQSFVDRISKLAEGMCGYLLPNPIKGSACKRLNLMLRWLVRSDDVDPGGWTLVGSERLIVPLDTHMHKIALALGLTKRRTPDLRTAQEITTAFGRISPGDPTRYDFALTRLGIRADMDMSDLLDGRLSKFKGKACA